MSNWQAIENNPEVLNDYMKKLGFIKNDYTFKELLALEDWAFDMCGSKVLGAILLFPYTPNHKKHLELEQKELEEKGIKRNEEIIFMKQYAKNACGTIALYHLLSNLPKDQEFIEKDSLIDKFINNNLNKTPEEVGNHFKNNEDIKKTHTENVSKGETEVKDDVYHHFVALVPFKGKLYEFDGHKELPIEHGDINDNNFKEVYAKIIKNFMNIDPEKITFSISLLSLN